MNVKRLKIYLDTSVVSHLSADDSPEKMKDTLAFWEKVKSGTYDVALSSITLAEIEECPEPKHSILLDFLSLIVYDTIIINEQTIGIAEKFVDFGIMRQKSFDDCQHIAAAITSNCNAIISWNFKHIVNHKTMQGIKAVTALFGYPDMLIYTPSILLGGDENDS